MQQSAGWETVVQQGFRARGVSTSLFRCDFLDRVELPVYRVELNQEERGAAGPLLRTWGKGLTCGRARIGALAEAVERFAAGATPKEPPVRAAYQELGDDALNPETLLPSYRSLIPADRQPHYHPQQPITWVWGESIPEGRAILLPAVAVRLQPAGTDGLIVATSSGLAAGECLVSATLHALCELVERDATMIVMRNRLVRDDVSLEMLPEAVCRGFDRAGLELRLKDLTTDIRIATVAAIASDPQQRYPSHTYGFGTHPDPRVACLRAATEAAQSRVVHRYYAMRFRTVSFPQPEQRRKIFAHLLEPGQRVLGAADLPEIQAPSRETLLDGCLAELRRAEPDLPMYRALLDLPEFPWRVVRLLIPGLVPPQANFPLVMPRLLDVPQRLELRPRPVRAEELWSGTWPH